jgi:outer membrane protein OmpA-like peptidoglycan-associated protein
LFAAPAFALNVQHLRPSTGATKGFQVHTSDTIEQGQFGFGLIMNYGQHLLRIRPNAPIPDQQILDEIIMADFLIDVALFDWWNVHIDVPLSLYHNVQPTVVSTADEGGGALGDISVRFKFQIFDAEKTSSGLGLALVPEIHFPTGQDSVFIGDDGFTGSITAVGDWQIHSNRLYLNAGYRMRNREVIGNNLLVVDEEITYGAGFQRPLVKDWDLDMIVEAHGFATLADNPRDQHRYPLELLFLGQKRWREDKSIVMTFGGGWGATEGYGTPNFRVILGLAYVHPVTEQVVVVREKIEITEKIHFEFDKAVIRPESYPVLDHVADVIKREPDINKVQVEGHTDAVGSDAYNQSLSERRSQAVVEYLVSKGTPRDHLVAKGFGESNPIASNDTAKGRATNRRTEFIIVERR